MSYKDNYNILNINDFGAVIDGNTDSVAINRTLTYASNNSVIRIPHGASGNISYSGITSGPSGPVNWVVDGVTSSGLPVQVFGNRPDLVENSVNGVKHLYMLRAPADHPGVLIIDYKTAANGGTNFVTTPIRVNATDDANTFTSIFGMHVNIDSYSNTPAAQHTSVGLNSTVNKRGTGGLQGIHISAFDWLGVSSNTTGPLTGIEISMHANGLDNYGNGAVFGGSGARALFHLSQQKNDLAGQNADFASMFQIDGDGSDANTYTKSIFNMGIALQTIQVLDTRGATVPPSYTGNVAAVRMLASQIIDFNGGASLTSNAGNYLQYTTNGSARLRYMDANTELFSISDSGNVTVGNTTSNTIISGTANVGKLLIAAANVNFRNLPTSNTGLPSGYLYKDANNFVKIT